MSIIEDIEKRIASYGKEDAGGNVTLEYGDFPIYGDGRTDHRGVTRRETINVRDWRNETFFVKQMVPADSVVLFPLPAMWPWENTDDPINATRQGAD